MRWKRKKEGAKYEPDEGHRPPSPSVVSPTWHFVFVLCSSSSELVFVSYRTYSVLPNPECVEVDPVPAHLGWRQRHRPRRMDDSERHTVDSQPRKPWRETPSTPIHQPNQCRNGQANLPSSSQLSNSHTNAEPVRKGNLRWAVFLYSISAGRGE